MKDFVQMFRESHKVFWDKISHSNPQEISTNCNVKFLKEKNSYIVPFLKDNYIVDINLLEIKPEKYFEKPSFQLYLVILTYLYISSNIELSGEFVSEQMLPTGNLFFRGVHSLPKEKFIQVYISNEEEFIKKCFSLGATQIHRHTDEVGLEFIVLPKFPVRLRLWKPDEEFVSDANFLFDKNADKILYFDAILSLIKVLEEKLT